VIEEGYSLDLVVDRGGEQPVAIEVDGPAHFVGHAPTGATLLKRRQLQHLGWHLVSVPYWEWDSLKHADESTQQRQRVQVPWRAGRLSMYLDVTTSRRGLSASTMRLAPCRAP